MKNLTPIVKIAIWQVASFALVWIGFFLDNYLDTDLYLGDSKFSMYLLNGTTYFTFFIGCWGLWKCLAILDWDHSFRLSETFAFMVILGLTGYCFMLIAMMEMVPINP